MVRDEDHGTIIRIGFLNRMKTNAHLLPEYKKKFDIIVTGDGPLLPTNLIIESIKKHTSEL